MSLENDLYNGNEVETTIISDNQKSGSGKEEYKLDEGDKSSNNVEISNSGFNAQEITNQIEVVKSYNYDDWYHELCSKKLRKKRKST